MSKFFETKYRVIEIEDGIGDIFYQVVFRPFWWPFWRQHSYNTYNNPKTAFDFVEWMKTEEKRKKTKIVKKIDV